MTTSVTLSSQRSELPGQCHTPGGHLSICPGQFVLLLTQGTSCCSSREGSQATNPEQKLSPIPGCLSIFHRPQFHLFAY